MYGLAVARPQPLRLPASSPRRILSAVDNLYLVQLEEIPDMRRWTELTERAGYMTQDQAGEWRLKVVAWKRWLELQEIDPVT